MATIYITLWLDAGLSGRCSSAATILKLEDSLWKQSFAEWIGSVGGQCSGEGKFVCYVVAKQHINYTRTELQSSSSSLLTIFSLCPICPAHLRFGTVDGVESSYESTFRSFVFIVIPLHLVDEQQKQQLQPRSLLAAESIVKLIRVASSETEEDDDAWWCNCNANQRSWEFRFDSIRCWDCHISSRELSQSVYLFIDCVFIDIECWLLRNYSHSTRNKFNFVTSGHSGTGVTGVTTQQAPSRGSAGLLKWFFH